LVSRQTGYPPPPHCDLRPATVDLSLFHFRYPYPIHKSTLYLFTMPSFPSPDGDPLYGCLASQHGLGHGGMARLLGVFGSASGVYGAGPKEWRAAHPRLTDAMVAALAAGPDVHAW